MYNSDPEYLANECDLVQIEYQLVGISASQEYVLHMYSTLLEASSNITATIYSVNFWYNKKKHAWNSTIFSQNN